MRSDKLADGFEFFVLGADVKVAECGPAGGGIEKRHPVRRTPEWSADALLDLQRLYREGEASLVTDNVQRLTGHNPITFDQFARD